MIPALSEAAESALPGSTGSGWRLKLVTFMSGAALMGLEMAGSRVLAIHYGSSIYVWGAVIGVFLAALSTGYYLGGHLADRQPTFATLNQLLLGAGLWVLAIPLFSEFVFRLLRLLGPGERLGTLLATGLLFAGPSVLIGAVSPFAVRLAAGAVEQVGGVAGRLYALSTLGSIAGTLIVAFWLVPALGIRAVLCSLGLTLVATAAISFTGRPNRASTFMLVAAALLAALPGVAARLAIAVPTGTKLIFETDSAYHHIRVVDDAARGARYLRFNNQTEGAISLAPPYGPRMRYITPLNLAFAFKPDLKRVLMIGGGGATWPRLVTSERPDVTVDLVELDPRVVEISRRFFHLSEGARLRVFTMDGREFVRRATEKYDLVVLDAYTIGGQIPPHLTTREFFGEVKDVLVPGGVLVSNVAASLEGYWGPLLRALAKTSGSVFGAYRAFPILTEAEQVGGLAFDPKRGRNVLLVSLNQAPLPDKDSLVRRAEALSAWPTETGPSVAETARLLIETPFRADDVPLLTDDYAPVETLLQ